jgi:hypothetical protein
MGMNNDAFAASRYTMLSRASWALYQDGLFAEASHDDDGAVQSWTRALDVAKRGIFFAGDEVELKESHRMVDQINERLARAKRTPSDRATPPASMPTKHPPR